MATAVATPLVLEPGSFGVPAFFGAGGDDDRPAPSVKIADLTAGQLQCLRTEVGEFFAEVALACRDMMREIEDAEGAL